MLIHILCLILLIKYAFVPVNILVTLVQTQEDIGHVLTCGGPLM